MSRRFKQAAVVLIVGFAAAQLAWTLVRPEARLSPQDVETICVAARQAEARMAGVSQ